MALGRVASKVLQQLEYLGNCLSASLRQRGLVSVSFCWHHHDLHRRATTALLKRLLLPLDSNSHVTTLFKL